MKDDKKERPLTERQQHQAGEGRERRAEEKKKEKSNNSREMGTNERIRGLGRKKTKTRKDSKREGEDEEVEKAGKRREMRQAQNVEPLYNLQVRRCYYVVNTDIIIIILIN